MDLIIKQKYKMNIKFSLPDQKIYNSLLQKKPLFLINNLKFSMHKQGAPINHTYTKETQILLLTNENNLFNIK